MKYKAAVLTVSDKASIGEREDKSGPAIKEILEQKDFEVVFYKVVPDEVEEIKSKLKLWAEEVDLVLTTGGTGLSKRDVTPEATLAVIERYIPGFSDAIRQKSLDITPHSMLSRAVSGTLGKTLIINLPGSQKAVKQSLDIVMPAVPHAIDILNGKTEH
ncbi:MAG: MogA/MoaB family molybdenum cofactor biosynthesis protein [Actinobacteria bacterium]|nr:MAG: MogA/MoaB family molybdenum cofactor biosynthesis protein [Actinomycetota bacterium]